MAVLIPDPLAIEKAFQTLYNSVTGSLSGSFVVCTGFTSDPIDAAGNIIIHAAEGERVPECNNWRIKIDVELRQHIQNTTKEVLNYNFMTVFGAVYPNFDIAPQNTSVNWCSPPTWKRAVEDNSIWLHTISFTLDTNYL